MLNLPDHVYEDFGNSAGSSVPANVIPLETIKRWIGIIQGQNIVLFDWALEKLVSELVKIYPYILLRPSSQQGIPHRVCNILLLFQCIAGNPETKEKFLKAKIAHYIFPLMDIGNMAAHFECLRLGALGVIDHLLNEPIDGAAVRFAMDTGVLHYCAKGVEFGCSQSKLHAVSIIESMLRTPKGLQYCCVLADRFFVIDGLLKKLLAYIPTMKVDGTCTEMFCLVVSCYAKLSQKSRARDGLRCYCLSCCSKDLSPVYVLMTQLLMGM
ncbi:unnamed protein product [Microthlaspi erraticum]|uniref:Uncharacterized protein n=1 Tax=Microthlaspi erraticum TaxID=1685480 RepID=A0A6D2KJJ4_9BRAS|nr:unnamed protein product [Microthlaspi erraticum]